MDQDTKYIPALNKRALTPLYDSVLKWVMREAYFKTQLIEQAHLQPGYVVLDIGCGTGTLAIMIKQICPDVQVIGLDGDEEVLSIAQHKAERAGTQIRFEHGLASTLPYQDNAFDGIFSSLVFHHLTTADKKKALKEAYRVLKRGGKFNFADFGPPQNTYAKLTSRFMSYFERVDDNVAGLLPDYFRQAGFANVMEIKSITTMFGTLTMLQADNK